MSVICKYLLSCVDPDYDSKLVESNLALAAIPFGMWTGMKSIYGRSVKPEFFTQCKQCEYGRRLVVNGVEKVYCRYRL